MTNLCHTRTQPTSQTPYYSYFNIYCDIVCDPMKIFGYTQRPILTFARYWIAKRGRNSVRFSYWDRRSENIDSVEFSWDLKARRAFVVRVQCGQIKERSRYGNLDEMQMVPRVPNAKLRPWMPNSKITRSSIGKSINNFNISHDSVASVIMKFPYGPRIGSSNKNICARCDVYFVLEKLINYLSLNTVDYIALGMIVWVNKSYRSYFSARNSIYFVRQATSFICRGQFSHMRTFRQKKHVEKRTTENNTYNKKGERKFGVGGGVSWKIYCRTKAGITTMYET